jgi:hypothetical protein
MGKILRIRVFVVVILAAAVAAAVATLLNQKQQLEAMDAAGRRDYLGTKLGGRVPDEQIDRIAAAISEKLDANKPVADVVEEAVTQAAEEIKPEGEESNPEG